MNKHGCTLQNALGKDKVVYMGDNFMPDYGADGRIDQATAEARDADVVILFLGTSTINPHVKSTVRLKSLEPCCALHTCMASHRSQPCCYEYLHPIKCFMRQDMG